jgi:hypothetical protein
MLSVEEFFGAEDGAVTVDWVVLTAAIVTLGIVVITTVAGGALDQSTGIGAYLGQKDVGTSGG